MIALVLLLQLANVGKENPSPNLDPLRVVNPLSVASLPSNMFGDGWRKSEGIIVDDWKTIDRLPAVHREFIDQLQLKTRLQSAGIVSVADYSLVRVQPPINTVTVNVFLFADVAKCDNWWKKKFQYSGWEKDFRIVDSERYQALDAIDTKYPNANKRLIKLDRLFLSAHQLGDDDKHLKAAEHIIDQLTRRDKQ